PYRAAGSMGIQRRRTLALLMPAPRSFTPSAYARSLRSRARPYQNRPFKTNQPALASWSNRRRSNQGSNETKHASLAARRPQRSAAGDVGRRTGPAQDLSGLRTLRASGP